MKKLEYKELNGGVVSVANNLIFVKLADGRTAWIQAVKDITGVPYLSVEANK